MKSTTVNQLYCSCCNTSFRVSNEGDCLLLNEAASDSELVSDSDLELEDHASSPIEASRALS